MNSNAPDRIKPTATPHMAGIVTAIVAASLTTSVTVQPILPMIMKEFADIPQAAVLVPMVISFPLFVSVLISPFVGMLSDRVDRRLIVIVASLLAAAVGVAPYFLPSLQGILVARLLMGFATGALLVCTSALIGDLFDGPQRRQVLGIKYAVLGITHVAAFIIIGYLAAQDWRHAFLIFLWGVPAALLVWFFIPAREARGTVAGMAAGDAFPIPWRALTPVFAGVFFGATTFDTLLTGIGFLLEERGFFGTVRGGFTASFASLGMLAGAACFPFLAARFSSRAIWAITFGLAAIGFALLAGIPAYPATVAGMVIAGTGCGLISPNSLDFMLGRVPLFARGRIVGIQTTFFYLGLACGPLVGVTLGKIVGSHVTLFWGVAVAMILFSALFALFGPEREPIAEPAA